MPLLAHFGFFFLDPPRVSAKFTLFLAIRPADEVRQSRDGDEEEEEEPKSRIMAMMMVMTIRCPQCRPACGARKKHGDKMIMEMMMIMITRFCIHVVVLWALL